MVSVTIAPVSLPPLPLGVVTLPSGKAINLTVAAGAGAYRHPSDPSRRIWTVTDRGPSLDCMSEPTAADKICPQGRRGRVSLLPGYSPAIYAIDLQNTSARFAEMITLKGTSGKPLTGIGMGADGVQDEAFFAADGRQLDADPSGIEPGGIVRLSDGTFFITDGYAPSILEVAPDGMVRRRLVPENLFETYRNADYPVEAVLPAKLAKRDVGRGLAAIALSPDEKSLYVSLQAPKHEGANSDRLAILLLDRDSGRVLSHFQYSLDEPSLSIDGPATARATSRIVEMQMMGDDQMLVLERQQATGKIYRVQVPSDGGSLPVQATKSLVFSSDRAPNLLGRLSAMAILSEREIAVLASDSGLEGARTQLFRLTFAKPLTN